jgi:hypothetical protein
MISKNLIIIHRQGSDDHVGAVAYYRRCLETDPGATDLADAHVGTAISLRAQALEVTEELEDGGDPEIVFSQLIILDTLTEEHLKIAIDPGGVAAADSGEEEFDPFSDLAVELHTRAQPVKLLKPDFSSGSSSKHVSEKDLKDLKEGKRSDGGGGGDGGDGVELEKLNSARAVSREVIRSRGGGGVSSRGGGGGSRGGFRTARYDEVTWKLVAEAELSQFLQVKVDIPKILLDEVKEGPRLKSWQVKKKKAKAAKS